MERMAKDIDTSSSFKLDIYVSPFLPIYFPAKNEGELDSVLHQVQLPNNRVVVSEELMEEIKRTVMGEKIDYDMACTYIESLTDARPNSLDEAELEVFALAVDEYEQIHYPIDLPNPIEAIKFRKEQEQIDECQP